MKFFRRQLHLLAWLFYLAAANFAAPVFGQPAAPEKQAAQVPVPEMVTIKPGTFSMGFQPTEEGTAGSDGPLHSVTIKYSFEVGKYDVTRDEYAAFVAETSRSDGGGCDVYNGNAFRKTPEGSWHNPGFAQSGSDPVVCVNWDDARAYARWLSGKTGKEYRLLSESEWEYVARAGTTAGRYWGDDIGSGHANCDGCGSAWDNKRTSPGGSFPPNAFGLYDMLGNVWQWTTDCWNNSYARAPRDGDAWQEGDCDMRILRGGSWAFLASNARVTFRYADVINYRSSGYGFRVARSL